MTDTDQENYRARRARIKAVIVDYMEARGLEVDDLFLHLSTIYEEIADQGLLEPGETFTHFLTAWTSEKLKAVLCTS